MNRWHSLHKGILVVAGLWILALSTAAAQTPRPASFELSPEEYDSAPTVQVALGDLDDDGDLDAVFANMSFDPSQVLLNNGHGSFVDTGQPLTEQGHGVGVGDLDGDGDLDLFITCAGYAPDGVQHDLPSVVYLNLGDGFFVDSGQDLGDTAPGGNAVSLADVDADGDLDAFVVYYGEPARVYLNDGSGAFTLSPQGLGSSNRAWIALGDLNNDGHVDAFVSRVYSPNEIWLNDGHGTFSDSGLRLGGYGLTRSVDLGDLDGDGDLDVFVARRDVEGAPNEVWVNCTRVGRCRNRSQPCCADATFIRRPSGRRRP